MGKKVESRNDKMIVVLQLGARDVLELKEKLRNCIGSLRRKPELVQSFFGASSLPIGPLEERKSCNYE